MRPGNLATSLIVLTGYAMVLFFGACHPETAQSTGVRQGMIAQLDTSQYTQILWKDTVINFGTAKEGDTVRLQFGFANSGNKLLFINDVRPSCGCTVADYPEKPVAPGANASITVLFTTAWHPGAQRKTVSVKTNTKERTVRTLLFFGNVLPKKSL